MHGSMNVKFINALNYFTDQLVLIYHMFTCVYQVQEFHHLGMMQLLVKGTCKLLINLPSSIVIQMWTVNETLKYESQTFDFTVHVTWSMVLWNLKSTEPYLKQQL